MLSLITGTKIRVIVSGGRTELKAVDEIGPSATAYDFYGNVFPFYVEKAEQQERRVYIMAGHGEAMVFGESHNILCREMDTPLWKRVPILQAPKNGWVRIPQKKVYVTPDLFNALDFDENGMFIGTEKIKDLFPLMEQAATVGITVNRHATEKRAEISKRRPICFASKLINGSFEADLEATLGGLTATGVLMPWKMYGPEVVEETKRTGIVFEGNCTFNDIELLPPRVMERPVQTYHVTFKEGMADTETPVELVWFTT